MQKDDVIYRQAAIEETWKEPSYTDPINVLTEVRDRIKALPSAQPEKADCDYCHEDSEGYVTPLEKNCHAFVRCSLIDGWILSLKYGAWRKDVSIRYCPMCGRDLYVK